MDFQESIRSSEQNRASNNTPEDELRSSAANANPRGKTLTRRQILKGGAGLLAAGLVMPKSLFAANAGNAAVGVGVLGAAHVHFERYARLLVAEAGIDVKAVYDDNPSLGRQAEELTGGARAGSVDEILDRDDIDAVVILSENIKHEAYAVAAAEAGKHLFVEKPLDIRGDRADRIAAAVKDAGVLFQTGYFMRSMNQLRFLRDAFRGGKFGRVTRMRVQYAHGGSLGSMWDGHHAWMVDLDQVGRGALGDLGIHCLNVILWMTEGDALQEISAQVGNATGRFGGIDEYGEALLRFESGLLVTMGAGYVDRNDVNRIEISGTEGHAYMNRGRVFLNCPAITGTNQERYWSDFPDALEHPFSLFLQALQGHEVPLVSVEEAARDVRVMDRIYAAAQA